MLSCVSVSAESFESTASSVYAMVGWVAEMKGRWAKFWAQEMVLIRNRMLIKVKVMVVI